MGTESAALPDGMATVFALAPHASFQMLDDGAVILDNENGQLYSCNEVTSAFLSRIDGRTSLDQIAMEIVGEYDVDAQTARDDLLDIVGKLHAEKLVRIV
jgi:hypothetical protein